jgi:hypothetical protein
MGTAGLAVLSGDGGAAFAISIRFDRGRVAKTRQVRHAPSPIGGIKINQGAHRG